jgi:hypothetical protein
MDIDITEVVYGRTINVGNYESVRVEYRARVKEGQTAAAVMAALKKIAAEEEGRVLRTYGITARLPVSG